MKKYILVIAMSLMTINPVMAMNIVEKTAEKVLRAQGIPSSDSRWAPYRGALVAGGIGLTWQQQVAMIQDLEGKRVAAEAQAEQQARFAAEERAAAEAAAAARARDAEEAAAALRAQEEARVRAEAEAAAAAEAERIRVAAEVQAAAEVAARLEAERRAAEALEAERLARIAAEMQAALEAARVLQEEQAAAALAEAAQRAAALEAAQQATEQERAARVVRVEAIKTRTVATKIQSAVRARNARHAAAARAQEAEAQAAAVVAPVPVGAGSIVVAPTMRDASTLTSPRVGAFSPVARGVGGDLAVRRNVSLSVIHGEGTEILPPASASTSLSEATRPESANSLGSGRAGMPVLLDGGSWGAVRLRSASRTIATPSPLGESEGALSVVAVSRSTPRPPLPPRTATPDRLVRLSSAEDSPLRTATPVKSFERAGFNALIRKWIQPRAQEQGLELSAALVSLIQEQAFAATNTPLLHLWYLLGTRNIHETIKEAQGDGLKSTLAAENVDSYTILRVGVLQRLGIAVVDWADARARSFAALKGLFHKLKPTYDKDMFAGGIFFNVLEAAAKAVGYNPVEIAKCLEVVAWDRLLAKPEDIFPPKTSEDAPKKMTPLPEEIETTMGWERSRFISHLIEEKKRKGEQIHDAGKDRNILPEEVSALERAALEARGRGLEQISRELEGLTLHGIWEMRARLFAPVEMAESGRAGAGGASNAAPSALDRLAAVSGATGGSGAVAPLADGTSIAMAAMPVVTTAAAGPSAPLEVDPENVFSPAAASAPLARALPPLESDLHTA